MPTPFRATPTLAALAVITLSSLLTACSGAADADGNEGRSNVQASAVQGGTTDTNVAHNYAVGVANRYGGVCTGTLIAPNLVLTARHCVVPPTNEGAVKCTDRFPTNVEASALFVTTDASLDRGASFYKATEIITPEDRSFCGNDIALIILDREIPATEARPATPVVQFSLTDARLGSSITAMGYGKTSPTSNDSGQRRIRENIAVLCIPGSKDRECTGKFAGLTDSTAEFLTEGFVCSGDSGGGAFDQTSFDQGTPFVLGALSRGPQTQERCLAAVYSRTDAHKEMIIAAGIKAAQGNYAAPPWTSSESPNGEPVCVGDVCTVTDATEPEAASPTSTTTTTTGCSAAPGKQGTTSAAMVGLAFAAALVLARRRRTHV